jgi:5-methylcytosine-specific restriction endonuclease McrA
VKTCTKCKAEKPKTEFYTQSKSKDGLQPNCSECHKALSKIWRSENKDRKAESNKAWRLSNQDRSKEMASAWYQLNKDRKSASSKARRMLNPEKEAANGRAWRKANMDIVAAKSRNRRAIIRGSKGTHTATDIKAIFEKQSGLCANCEVKLFKSGKNKFHADHIMPLALGGSNWPANLQCLCPTCNLSKGAKHPDDWAKENGKLF